MATITKHGFRLIQKNNSAEVQRWPSVPQKLDILGVGTFFNVQPNFDTPTHFIEPVSWDVQVTDPATTAEIIDAVFPQTGVGKALFEALFEVANRLQALESKPTITRSQLRDWLVAKAS